jgi:hypothetical protein
MRPWTIGEKIMGTYHHMAIAPWKLSVMLIFTQNENMNKRGDIMGTITIAWWSWSMLPSHQCYKKLDHEHEHDQKKLWALANVWPPHHNDDLMLLSAYTKWELKPTMNMIKKMWKWIVVCRIKTNFKKWNEF